MSSSSGIIHNAEMRKLQALGLLAAGVAHDFNNLLAVIDGYAGMLQRQLVDPKMQAKLQAILNATNRAAELTQALMAYRAAKAPDAAACDLGEAICEARSLMKIVLGSRIELVLRLPDRMFPVTMDADSVTEILLHLAAHARTGGVRGNVLTLELADGGQGACLQVGDGGSDPYPCADDAVAGRVGAMPAGMPQMAEILRGHGGLLRISAGQGADMTLVFPRVERAAEETLHGKTVLVVDDEIQLLPVLEDRLQDLGLRVLKAANAEMALALARDYVGVIDVLLTDLVMPETDGVRLAELMSDARPEISVVYMTGYGDQVRQMSFSAYLPEDVLIVAKPFRGDDLSSAMQKAIEELD